MSSTEILRIRNCIHIAVIFSFHLEFMSKSVGIKILGLKLAKLDCKKIILYLDKLKKLKMSWIEPVACLLSLII